MRAAPRLYGVAASFASVEGFLAALRRLRTARYDGIEVNVPFAVEGMAELLPRHSTPMAKLVLLGGLAGAGGGYFLQWYATRDFPLNSGGRPLHSWPAFVPVTFELTVLTATLVGVIALLWLTGLPRLDHPMFDVPGFERASQDRFFLCLRADDPRFDQGGVWSLFESLGAEQITEVFT